MEALLKLRTIPAIVQQTQLITVMTDGEYLFAQFSLERAEMVRKTLRDLMAYLPNEKNYVVINVVDWVEIRNLLIRDLSASPILRKRRNI